MFIHIRVFDKQISIHILDATEDDPADPLSVAVEEALEYWNRKEKNYIVVNEEGKKLDLKKSAKDNKLEENSFITIKSKK